MLLGGGGRPALKPFNRARYATGFMVSTEGAPVMRHHEGRPSCARLGGRGRPPYTSYAFDFLNSSNASRKRSMSCFDR